MHAHICTQNTELDIYVFTHTHTHTYTHTNLDSVLKSGDITLPTQVHIVKATWSSQWCESWTVKKAERKIIDAFELWVLEKTPESPLDSKEIKPVKLKGNQP